MAATIRRVDYFTTQVSNKPGEAARILAALRDLDMNLLAFTGFPRGRRAQLDFVPDDPPAFKKAARSAQIEVEFKKSGFLAQGEDRPGAVADILGRLADVGINVTAIDAVSAGEGRFGAIFWVKPEDVTKAKRALKAI